MAMEKALLRAEEADAGKRLDGWIAEKCPDLTRSFAQKLIESGKVEVDGRPAGKKDKNLRVTSGMEVSLTLPEPEPLELKPENIPLDIVYEDEDLLVVNKPKGMVVHPAPGHPAGTLVHAPPCPLRGLPLRHQRGAAPRHRPPDRPGTPRGF